MRLLFIFTLSFLMSCASKYELSKLDSISLLKKIQFLGQGKCRLSVSDRQDVFSCESLLKDFKTWILVIEVPFKGEELFILPDINQSFLNKKTINHFELRIMNYFKENNVLKKVSPLQLLQIFHEMIRFLAADQLKLTRDCYASSDRYFCNLDNKKFEIKKVKESLEVLPDFSLHENKLNFKIVAENFHDSVFQKTSVFIYSNEKNVKNHPVIGIEFFWSEN